MDPSTPSTSQRSMHPERTPQLIDLETRIQNLIQEGQRDDAKLKTLQEIWTAMENNFTHNSHEKVVEKLMLSILSQFCNTSPQFIQENNTQMLRKLMLEIVLRVSNTDVVKSHSKDILKQMMRLISVENEENALLAMKILVDQGRTAGKMEYCREVQSLLLTLRTMVIELTAAGRSQELFLLREPTVPPPSSTDEQLITEYLTRCYYSQQVILNGNDPEARFNLIPSAHLSVKVLMEVPFLVIFFYQHFKTSVQTEVLEFTRLCLDFLNVEVPTDKAKFHDTLTDDFVTVQSKILSFVNIMAKIPAFMDCLQQNGDALVSGTMQMLNRCPPELINVRREVLLSLKYFTAGEMKTKFFGMLPRLISEHFVLGTGFTAIEILRVFMYQMLADLMHHMRDTINYEMISHVVFVFCRALHDPNNSAQVLVMSARLLNSLAESLVRMESDGPIRDLMMEILESQVAKLKVLAVYHMPLLFQQHGSDLDYEYKNYERETDKPGTSAPKDTMRGAPKRRTRKLSVDSVEELEFLHPGSLETSEEEKKMNELPPITKENTKKTSPGAILNSLFAVTAPPLALSEARNLIKYIMHTCKFLTSQLRISRCATEMYHCTRERDLYERLLRYGVMCMDIFVLPTSRNQPQPNASQRSKDEKDALESLACVFTSIDHAIFRELFEKYMDFLIERIYNRNYPLQLMVNTFLVRNEVPFFASTMLSFLMSRMKLLEINNDKTALYVKLFKIIFSAIGANNSSLHHDKMLTTYLPEILKQSTVMALTAREPLNYFLLLRSLFRSIGAGSQDILYGTFLQLLPNLLQFLNKLTSCQHRVQMRELFVELCLTVPVRLSSLLPYLPLLMDPLVCAMNGSPQIVTQGLRTLELCVDNLQPEYLLENMLPVRGALMQGLYRVVSKAPDQNSMAAAFKILGKFGGANRKHLNQPQLLQVRRCPDSYFNMEFSRNGREDANHSLQLPLSELMRVAADQMRYPADQLYNPNPTNIPSNHMKKCCMELSKSVLLAGLGSSGSLTTPNKDLPKILKKLISDFDPRHRTTEIYVCPRENDRELYVNALLALTYGIWNKDGLRHVYSKFFVRVLRQFALMGVFEFVGGNDWMRQAEEEGCLSLCLDSSVLVDALITCLSETTANFMYGGVMCLRYINDTLSVALPDIDQMSKVPMCKYLMEKVFKLCYGPAWFARAGGIHAIGYMIENFPRKFVMDFVIDVVDSIMEVILGLVEEIASGAADSATECMKKMMRVYFIQDQGQEEENLTLASIFVAAIAKHYFHSNDRIREYMWQLMDCCRIQSRLAPDLNSFYYRFRQFFEPEFNRILATLPTMSLSDAGGCLDSLQHFMFICPDGFEFEKDLALYRRYTSHLLDLAQTDTYTISQRNAFKKCETCPSHFLPPFPITSHIDAMRASALQCLVVVYARLRKQLEGNANNIEDEKLMSEVLGMGIPTITVEHIYENKDTWRRVMTVLLRAVTDKDILEIADKLHPVLMKAAPVPTNIIATFGANNIRNISRATDVDDPEKQFSYHDCRKFNILFDLNPKILVKNIATNLANHMIRYKMSDKISTILGLPTANSDQDEATIAYEAEKKKGIRELDVIGFTARMLAECSMATLNDPMIVDIARFAAHFEYTYSQDVLPNWVDDVVKIMNKSPVEVWKFFMDRESVADPARRSLIRRAIVFPASEPLRDVFMKTPEYLERLIDRKKNNYYDNSDDRVIADREMFLLSLVDRISRNCPEWLSDPSLSPIPELKLFFNNEFTDRYSVRSINEDEDREIRVINMTEEKYKVPKLITNIFIRYLRTNIRDYDMFFNVVAVFMGKYQTDFSFVREFLEVEVIPKMPLWWRREIFIKVMVMFEENAQQTCKDVKILKVIQYLIIPSLQWAFERYDTDEIVGSAPIDDSDGQMDPDNSSTSTENLVARLTTVIGSHRLDFSDGMIILFYQLCTLFVQHAPEHIHNNHCKKQGGRLRNFMLFAWPCLATPNRQDPTLRYTGYYFLANIIERFTINRKIVLQVFQQLMTNYQQDPRDQVRKAVDILTPALRVRMEDGHQQVLLHVKKILIEEGHVLVHMQHMLSTIVRNYRVYYHIRYEIITPLLNAVQRALTMPNSIIENWQTRRQAIEVCEMIIKWELFRMHKSDHVITDDEASEVDKQLEKLRGANSPERFDFEDQKNKRDLPESERVIPKEQVDIVVNMMLRFCMTFHQNTQAIGAAVPNGTELVKKCQLLLRVCLRSSVWGDFAHIRTSMIQNYLTIPLELAPKHNEMQSVEYASAVSTAQCAIDTLNAIIPIMPKPTLLFCVRPLQAALITILQSSGHIARGFTHLISRLGEKTTVTEKGLEDFEMLNSYISKFIQDNFFNILRNTNNQVLNSIGAFSILRAVCAHEPAYLDNFMQPFIKIMDRTAKEHLAMVASNRQPVLIKNAAELLAVCMELIRHRVDHLSLENKRALVQDMMSDLIHKTTHEKVLQTSAKLVGAMMSTTELDFSVHICLQQLVRIQTVIMTKFKNSKELITDFIVVIIKVFEVSEYRNSEYGSRLWEAFFWGLKSMDPTTRENFSIVWEMSWPKMSTADLCYRMKYIMRHQDWSKFKHAFWLKFAMWGALRAVSKSSKTTNNQKKKVVLLNCATPWRTIEYAARLREQPMELDEEIKQEEPEPMDTDEKNTTEDAKDKEKLTLDDLLREQQELLEEAAQYDFADALDTISNISFALADNNVTSRIWVTFFKSFWASLERPEVEEFTQMVVPFLSSGTHNYYQTGVQDSVLAVWLEALNDKVQLPSRLIEFIASKHECWYTGIGILENSIWSISKQLNNHLLGNMNVDPNLLANIETLESLGALYNELCEFDQYSAIWERRSVFPETMRAMTAIQLGDIETAATVLEQAMANSHNQIVLQSAHPNYATANTPTNGDRHISPAYDREYDQWMKMYISSCSELSQWQTVAEVCNSKDMQDVRGLITAATHIPDWNAVEECKNQISGCIPPDFHLEYSLFNLMSTVMNQKSHEGPNWVHAKEKVKLVTQECIEAHISRWRALPSVISYGHVKILQSMNLIRDIEESTDMRFALIEPSNKMETNFMQDMKNLMKLFRNRTPTQSDDMEFVASWYDWRNQIHGMMLQRFEWFDKSGLSQGNHGNLQSIVPIHSMAQAQMIQAKHAKRLGFYNLSKDLLNKTAVLSAIPMMDAVEKVCTYAQTLRAMSKNVDDEMARQELLFESLEVLEDITIEDFQRDQVTSLLFNRATIHSDLGQTENANVAFSAAAQMIDMKTSNSLTGIRLYRQWGNHLSKLFFDESQMVTKETCDNYGRQALACYFIAARVDNDVKARKPIAKILWLAKHMMASGAEEALNRIIKKQLHSLNLFNWLYWIPQLITEIRHTPNSNFVLLLCRVASAHPLQVFYYIREAASVEEIDAVFQEDYTEEEMSMEVADDEAFLTDPPFVRVLKICLKYRPTDVRVFHRVLKELDVMTETWVERHLRFAITIKDQLFEDFADQMDAHFNEVQFSDAVLDLTQKWRKQLEVDYKYFEENYNLDLLEIKNKRKSVVTKGYMGDVPSQIMFEKELSQVFTDPPEMKNEMQFVDEVTKMIFEQLDIRSPTATRPLIFVRTVLEWIRVIRRRFDRLPRRIPTEVSSPWLSRFSHRTGCIEMPFDLLNVLRPKNHTLMASNQTGQYISMMSRFEPNFEILMRGGQVTRKIYIRGQTGKSVAFYLKKSIKDEPTNRVPQFFKHVDHLLQTDRETSRRHLQVPSILQMKVSKNTTLYEVASVQPYALPPDSARNYPASQIEIVHPYEVLTSTFNGLYSPDDMVMHFYERFGESCVSIGQPLPQNANAPMDSQPRLTEAHHVKNIIHEDFARDMIPYRLLTDYLLSRYPDPVMFYAMRKQFIHSFAVLSILEYHCNLSPMTPLQMMLTMNTGVLSNPFYRFELGDGTLQDIDHFAHEVPFRLTPNLIMLVGVAQDGDLLWSMAAVARCLMKKEPGAIMRPLLWDEYANNIKYPDMKYICHAANSYVKCFETKVAMTNRPDAKMKKDDCNSLIIRAKDTDNLSRMPPTYHAWF